MQIRVEYRDTMGVKGNYIVAVAVQKLVKVLTQKIALHIIFLRELFDRKWDRLLSKIE